MTHRPWRWLSLRSAAASVRSRAGWYRPLSEHTTPRRHVSRWAKPAAKLAHAILSAHMFAPHSRAALAIVILTGVGCSRPPQPAADLIVTHATIWTGDAAQPT